MINIIGIEHVAIAANRSEKSRFFFEKILGVDFINSESIDEQGVITEIFDAKNGKIELLKPINNESKISNFLKKRGTGLHHICFEVENIVESITHLKNNNIELIGDNYSIGAEGYKVVFIHPKSTGGILVELAEK
tara:strand:+ start:20 stop:424 length:405 start_codon:yes stop_codon:yes gene_type:complete